MGDKLGYKKVSLSSLETVLQDYLRYEQDHINEQNLKLRYESKVERSRTSVQLAKDGLLRHRKRLKRYEALLRALQQQKVCKDLDDFTDGLIMKGELFDKRIKEESCESQSMVERGLDNNSVSITSESRAGKPRSCPIVSSSKSKTVRSVRPEIPRSGFYAPALEPMSKTAQRAQKNRSLVDFRHRKAIQRREEIETCKRNVAAQSSGNNTKLSGNGPGNGGRVDRTQRINEEATENQQPSKRIDVKNGRAICQSPAMLPWSGSILYKNDLMTNYVWPMKPTPRKKRLFGRRLQHIPDILHLFVPTVLQGPENNARILSKLFSVDSDGEVRESL